MAVRPNEESKAERSDHFKELPPLQCPAAATTTAVVHPQPTTRALHLRQIGLRAVMGLKPQPGPASRFTVAWNCDPTTVPPVRIHPSNGASSAHGFFQQGFGFAALMQGDLALHQPPAEIRLRRLRNSVIQRETMSRSNKCAQAHGQKRAARERAICSTRIRDAMAQQLQVDCNVGSTDSLVLRAVRCRH